ncbi:putative phage tail protein [Nocardia nova SH22a]|uniref:Putative phage tail protein n=1 Tax=Nocardia nova SH22a TaxID=1415166 RepID=W5TBP9_9NOCA|nr:hypothetical protein [Nocardia nova]AHH16594.1 putative phage tail protein [Nocardia nova SH22a]
MSTVGEYFAATLIRGINEGIGTSDEIVQSMQGTPADGSFELPTGSKGVIGPTGLAAFPWRWEGDIADPTALAALTPTLGTAQAGKAWRVRSTNTIMYWNGSTFESFSEAIGGRGPDGVPNVLTIGTVTTGAAGADVVATITGDPPNQVIGVVLPRGVKGVKGPVGPPGPLRGASDYDDTAAPTDGAVPVWNASAAKWKAAGYPGWRGPWTVIENQAWDGSAGFSASASGISTSPNTVCILNVPAQDVAWRPFLTGGAIVRTADSGASVRVDLEARLGSAAGQIVAVGTGMPYAVDWLNRLQPQYQVSAMTPDSSVGVISAGVAAAIYLVLRRNAGSGNYTYSRTGAHAAVWAVPVTGAP